MLVKELYQNSIILEKSSLAHYLHHLLTEKKISLEDDAAQIDFNQANHQKVAEMIQKNVLGFHKVGIYSLKMNEKAFVFVYARSEEEGIHFCTKYYHHAPLNCHEYPLEVDLTRGNEIVSFQDMKKEFTKFPALAGIFLRN